MRLFGLIAVAVTMATSCASIGVQPTSPQPDIALAPSSRSLGLDLDADIDDDFVLPSDGALGEMHVYGWRKTLRAGFENGFGPYFVDTTAGQSSDMILKVKAAKLTFISADEAARNRHAWWVPADGANPPRIVLVHGGPDVHTPAKPRRRKAHALIRYEAALTDSSGQTLRHSHGVVVSANATDGSSPAPSSLVRGTVELMYESIANDLFPVTMAKPVPLTAWLAQ